MREIKFRVWDTEEKEYVNKYYHNLFIISQEGNLFTLRNGEIVEVSKDRYIIEQSTGLHDKNGVEIYEGDVLKLVNNYSEATKKRSSQVVVKYKEGSIVTAWDEVWDDGSKREVYNHFSSYNTPIVTFEVIGNIHEEA